MEEAYTKLSELCCKESTVVESLEQIGVKKTKFYSHRYIVELSLVDKEEYERILSQDLSMLMMNKLCKQRLQKTHRRQKVASLRQIGLLLGWYINVVYYTCYNIIIYYLFIYYLFKLTSVIWLTQFNFRVSSSAFYLPHFIFCDLRVGFLPVCPIFSYG